MARAAVPRQRGRKRRADWWGRTKAALAAVALGAVLLGPWLSRNTWILWVAASVVALALAGWLHLLRRRHLRNAALARSVAATDGMTGRQFEEWTADLLRRSGFTDVQLSGGAYDRGADLTAYAPNGARTVVQCKRYAPHRKVSSPDIQRFGGTARPLHGAQIALLITTGGLTTEAAAIAAQLAITVVTRPHLMHWAAHDHLPHLIQTPTQRP